MRRKRFSESEVVTILLQQGAKIRCPRCGQLILIGEVFEREHFHELALGGGDNIANSFFSHKACHAFVTNGGPATTAGSSKNKIAKTKRIASGGRKRKGRQIPSRPFPKIKRTFSHVVPWR